MRIQTVLEMLLLAYFYTTTGETIKFHGNRVIDH